MASYLYLYLHMIAIKPTPLPAPEARCLAPQSQVHDSQKVVKSHIDRVPLSHLIYVKNQIHGTGILPNKLHISNPVLVVLFLPFAFT